MTPFLNSPKLRTVLLVDSDSENRDFLRKEFESIGFTILEAEDCQSTLEVLSTNQVGAVVLDLECSARQRAALMSQIQSEKHGNPHVFLLVSPSVLSREEAYDLGAAGVMSKPVDPSYLIGRITHILTPAPHRWNRPVSPARRRTLVASLARPQLGRGGFTISGLQLNELLEGETVEFNVEVNDSDRWMLTGTGVVRYVNLDSKSRRQRAWGIEFESLEETSLKRVIESTSSTQQMRYIPRYIS